MGIGGDVRGGKKLALIIRDELFDLDEDVPFEDTTGCFLTALDNVAVNIVSHVIDGVEESGAA